MLRRVVSGIAFFHLPHHHLRLWVCVLILVVCFLGERWMERAWQLLDPRVLSFNGNPATCISTRQGLRTHHDTSHLIPFINCLPFSRLARDDINHKEIGFSNLPELNSIFIIWTINRRIFCVVHCSTFEKGFAIMTCAKDHQDLATETQAGNLILAPWVQSKYTK